jgi:crotonobetainyl-CoA:carnitine CoA-transferase CaiB-like acyl-CoA transferase
MDPQFDTASGRWQGRHTLDAQLEQWTATYDNQALMQLLQAHGVPAGAVLTARDLAVNPHLHARSYFEIFTNANAPRVGPRLYAGRPFRIPNIPEALTLVSALGQHNVQILREVAKLSEGEIQQLLDAGLIASRPQELGKPAAAAARSDARERGTRVDPEYREHLRDFMGPIAAAAGGDD